MIAITNGKVVTVTGQTFENGTVLIEDGKIKAVGQQIAVPQDAQLIDASGCWVTPGLIDCHTHISNFNEPGTLTGSDGNEITDPLTPQVRAMDAVNPYDYAISKVREAGFTTVCILPGSANVIGGTGIVIKLRDVQSAEEMIIPGTEQMKFATGENPKHCYGPDKKSPMTRMGVAAVMRGALYKTKVYSDRLKAAETDPSKAPEPDFKLDALVPVMRREMKCRIHAHRADDIFTAIRIAKDYARTHGAPPRRRRTAQRDRPPPAAAAQAPVSTIGNPPVRTPAPPSRRRKSPKRTSMSSAATLTASRTTSSAARATTVY
mgnify:CR=1 FL=1